MMKMKIFFILGFLIIACVVYAIGRKAGGIFGPSQCGGYRYSDRRCNSMEDEKASIDSIAFFFYEEGKSYRINMDSENFKTSMNPDSNFYLSQNYTASVTKEFREKIEKYLRESGLLKFNGWCVEVNGLPMTKDANVSIRFDNGKSFYMHFNGCHAPEGFYEAAYKFIDKIIPVCGYDPEKKEKIPHHVDSFAGTHESIYERKNEKNKSSNL